MGRSLPFPSPVAATMVSSGHRRLLAFFGLACLVVFAVISLPNGPNRLSTDLQNPLVYWNLGNTQLSQQLSPLPSSAPATIGLIPKHIWQIFFYDQTNDGVNENVATWHKENPECTYTRLTRSGSEEFVKENFASRPDIVELYMNLRLPMLRGDLLRYMILATRGGVYADMDVKATQPLRKWVPKQYRNRAAAVVGIEFDKRDGPILVGYTYELQFASWTLAGAPGHQMYKLAVERIKERLYALAESQNCTLGELEPSDDDILNTTGPAAWTAIVLEALTRAAGREIGTQDLLGLQEPTLFGDILVLAIDGFAGNVPHSGAGSHPDQMLIWHQFAGTWRGSGQRAQND
jgi:alpha 1,6-mannosyltransferase